MARESALWQRLKKTIPTIQSTNQFHISRIENSAGDGQPDVEGCLDATQGWLELKSELRPARPKTIIRPKTRQSQSDWHKLRTLAGGRTHWVLIQIGEGKKDAALYLIPGKLYDRIKTIEANYELMCVNDPCASPEAILRRAFQVW